MILPLSSMDVARAASNDLEVNQRESTLENQSRYAELLLNMDDYGKLSAEEKATYLDFLESRLNSQDPYQIKVNELIETLSDNVLHLQDAVSTKRDGSIHTEIISEIVTDLENYGVVQMDKLTENPEYWASKARQAQDRLRSGDDITLIHTGDVSVQMEATIFFPCFPRVIEVQIGGCPTLNGPGWGTGTTTDSVYVLMNGHATWNSFACLENPVAHSTVSWYMSGHHKKKPLAASAVEEFYPPAKKTVAGSNTHCTGFVENRPVTLADRLDVSVTVYNPITVTGSHA